jgi:DNA processing protein
MAHHFGKDPVADAHWLALTQGIAFGARWLDQMLQRFPSPLAILNCSQGEAQLYGLASLQRSIDSSSTQCHVETLAALQNLYLVVVGDREYPPLLAQCSDRPPFLFVYGDVAAIGDAALSIVGTRRPSLEGRRAAEAFAAEAVRLGRVVVSGLALGIDALAHEAALMAGGRTVAVLPSGINRIYPARHRDLGHRIACSGALVSEFPFATPPRKHHFYRRNRTLSGLSAATLVIEAGRPSGTLITASAAADQGRDVMALPWSIYHPQGAGCRFLLEDGALPLYSIASLEEHIGTLNDLGVVNARRAASSQPRDQSLLDGHERAIMQLIGRSSATPEELALHLRWDLDHCLSCLSGLEVTGWVTRGARGYIAIQSAT